MLKDKKLKLIITNSAKEWLPTHGFDNTYGARPLKRLIQKDIQNKLAQMILAGKIKEEDKIKIDANKDGIKILKSN